MALKAALTARLFFGNPLQSSCRSREQARICAEELPPGTIHERVENMGTIAKLLRMRLKKSGTS